jgi:hypothetical protein
MRDSAAGFVKKNQPKDSVGLGVANHPSQRSSSLGDRLSQSQRTAGRWFERRPREQDPNVLDGCDQAVLNLLSPPRPFEPVVVSRVGKSCLPAAQGMLGARSFFQIDLIAELFRLRLVNTHHEDGVIWLTDRESHITN